MRALVPTKIGQAWVLLDAEIIREILGSEVWLPIPVVDLAAPFGLDRLSAGEARARTLIASVAESIVAVPVDAAREVHAFGASQLKAVSISHLPYAAAEAELFERILPVIDLRRFVTEISSGAAPELDRGGMASHVGVG